MRRPRQTSLDPGYFDSGSIGHVTAAHDQYFTERPESTLRIVLDQFVQRVPEPQKTALEMCVMKRCTYKEAADWFTTHRGVTTDPKTVWRWAQQGVEMMGKMLAGAAWASTFVPNLPEPDDE